MKIYRPERKKISDQKLLNYSILKEAVFTEHSLRHPKVWIFNLKKICSIIHKYHMGRKSILFAGVPFTVFRSFSLLKKITKHSFIPDALWVNGTITNPCTRLSVFLKKKSVKI